MDTQYTVRDIYETAARLMDAQNESTGDVDTTDTREYRLRTPSLLNSILDRAYPASDTYPRDRDPGDGRRPVCPKVSSLEDPVALDGRLCTGVLPYGLAGLLLAEENPALAGFFWQTFLEELESARRSLAAEARDVEDAYGILADSLEFGRFARWEE